MAARTSYQHGQFCWVDLMAHDLGKAKAFYSALLGWQAVEMDTGGGPVYVTLDVDGVDPADMPGTGSPEPGGLRMRDTQVISPASLCMSICQTWVLRPRWTGRVMPVTQPVVAPLRWLALMSRPTQR